MVTKTGKDGKMISQSISSSSPPAKRNEKKSGKQESIK
jgi:hypothetical protein